MVRDAGGPMYTITKSFTFEAAHRLLGHPKCGRLHGHSYEVTVELRSSDLQAGMIRDYADLSAVKTFIDENLDHRYLVSKELEDAGDPYLLAASPADIMILDIERTTAEELAKYLY